MRAPRRIESRGRPDVRRYRRYVEQEFDNVVLYRRLAQDAEDEHREVLLELAAAEEQQRQVLAAEARRTRAERRNGGVDEHRPARGTRLLSWLARHFGLRTIVPVLERLEAAERGRYGRDPEAAAGLTTDELVHAQLVAGLSPAWRTRASGSLRATVFGLNDGLVSNLALVMGMEGGNAGRNVVLLAGLAGLVAAPVRWPPVSTSRCVRTRAPGGERRPTADELRAVVAEGSVAQLELLMRLRGVAAGRAAEIASSR